MAKKFSVILPIYGYEEGYLEVRVESWMNQNYPDEDFEVIIVEDGSPDQARVAETLSKYKKVRLILLPENHGRIEARNIGVNLAAHDTVCLAGRYVVEPDYLSKLSQLEYYPAIVPPVTDPEGTTYFGRLFYLFRRRIYPKYFPPERYTPFYIDETNYKKVPKHLIGITCAKDLWSEARPDVKDKYTHDEAIILRNLIRLTGRVLVAGGIRLMYQRRRGFWEELRHMKGRGPLFASFYFVPGGRYHKWYLAAWIALVMLVGLSILDLRVPLAAVLVLLVALLLVSSYLAERASDVAVVLTHLPPLAVYFGMGVLAWQWRQIRQLFRRQRPYLGR